MTTLCRLFTLVNRSLFRILVEIPPKRNSLSSNLEEDLEEAAQSMEAASLSNTSTNIIKYRKIKTNLITLTIIVCILVIRRSAKFTTAPPAPVHELLFDLDRYIKYYN